MRDLSADSPGALGIDVANGFKPMYQVTNKEVVARLRKLLTGAEALYLATDPDREGEAIAWHLCEAIRPVVPVRRIAFTEITKAAIDEALARPRPILVKAQEARRMSDRLIGFMLSPLLFKRHAVPGGKSVGRVQSPSLRLLVEREYERRYFRSGRYWAFSVQFKKDDVILDALLHAVDGLRIASSRDFNADTGTPRQGRSVNAKAKAR